jgi:hypothetical protein
LNQFVDFHEILKACDAIRGDLDAVIFNPSSFNRFKMVEIQICEVDALPALYSLALQSIESV